MSNPLTGVGGRLFDRGRVPGLRFDPETSPEASGATAGLSMDMERRRDQLTARVAELQWDLGGLVYEMAVRDQIHVDVLIKRAAVLQEADAELGEIERILKLEETGMAGTCPNCGAPHSTGASFCWQCGQPLLAQAPATGNGAG